MPIWLSILLIYLAGGMVYLFAILIQKAISEGRWSWDLSVEIVPASIVFVVGLFGYPFYIYAMIKDWLEIHWNWLRRRKNKKRIQNHK